MEDRFRFRAWDIEEKKMNYFQNKRGMQYNNDEIRISNGWDGYDNPKYWGGDDEDYVDRTDKYILMQCTGLKDKNGKLIYEGDIVKYTDCEGKETIGSLTIDRFNLLTFTNMVNCDFCEEWADVVKAVFFTGNSTIEVIGNIYENKELLEEI